MARRKQASSPDPVEEAIRNAGSIGALERLAGIGQTQDDRFAFWQQFTILPATESLDAGVAGLKRLIWNKYVLGPDAVIVRARGQTRLPVRQ